MGLIAVLGRSPGGGHGDPLQYSCLESPVDREAWQAMAHYKLWTSVIINASIVVAQSLDCVQLFAAPWTAAHQAPLSFTIS